jgi:deoxyribonuclease-4
MISLGGHVSCSGGVLKAIERAEALEFNCLQIHPTAPQSWGKPTTTDEEAADFAKTLPERGIRQAFFHNIYLTNFASESQSGWHGSIEITKSYMALAAKMKVDGVVTHLGSHKGIGMVNVLDHLTEGLNRMLSESPPEATFLIENTAGAGGSIGRSLEEIQMILDKVWPLHPNVGICIDTCHAFASGIPIHTQKGLNLFVKEFKERFGMEALRCIHLNDSKNEFNTFKDRHQNIGDGFIGNEAFSRILHNPDLQKVPFIMEVPGLEDKGPDAGNRDRVRALAA